MAKKSKGPAKKDGFKPFMAKGGKPDAKPYGKKGSKK